MHGWFGSKYHETMKTDALDAKVYYKFRGHHLLKVDCGSWLIMLHVRGVSI